ncbi:MAG: hypothetical protein ACRCYU_12400 [Nocardioides sp.]
MGLDVLELKEEAEGLREQHATLLALAIEETVQALEAGWRELARELARDVKLHQQTIDLIDRLVYALTR